MQNMDSVDLSLSSEASSSDFDVVVDDVSQSLTAMITSGDDVTDTCVTCKTSSHTCTVSPVPMSAVQETSSSHASQTVVYSQLSEPSCYGDSLPSSAGSMAPVSSVSPPRLPDFSGIEIPQWDYPAELREPEYDAVVISTMQDTDIAEMFSYIVSEFIILEDGRRPQVCTLLSGSNFVHTQSRFRHMDEALKHSTYMFLIVTRLFCTDRWAEVQRDESLMESITNPEKRWCVVPVVMQSRNESFQLPFGLRALKGINVSQVINGRSLADVVATSDRHWRPTCSDVDPLFLNSVKLMLDDRLQMKLKREAEQRRALESWIREEQVRRYVVREREALEAESEQNRLQRLYEQHKSQLDTTSRMMNSTHPVTSPIATTSQPPQQPAAVTNQYVFNAPIHQLQIGDSNVMQPSTDSTSPTPLSLSESPLSSYQVCVDSSLSIADTSLDSGATTDVTLSTVSHNPSVSEPRVTVSSFESNAGLTTVTQCRPTVNVTSTISTDVNWSVVLPSSPGSDGLPPQTPSTADYQATTGLWCTSAGPQCTVTGPQNPTLAMVSTSSGPRCAAVAVVSPFSAELTDDKVDDDDGDTCVKTVVQTDDDEETDLKQIITDGNTTRHSADGNSRRHVNEQTVDAIEGTSAAGSDTPQRGTLSDNDQRDTTQPGTTSDDLSAHDVSGTSSSTGSTGDRRPRPADTDRRRQDDKCTMM